MIPLVLTAELEETWTDETGIRQSIIVKLAGCEVVKFEPTSFIHSSARRDDIEYEVARWLKGRLAV